MKLLKIGFSLPSFKNPFILPYPIYTHDLPCMLLYMPYELLLCNCRACELCCLSNCCLWANGLPHALYCGLIGFYMGIVGV